MYSDSHHRLTGPTRWNILHSAILCIAVALYAPMARGQTVEAERPAPSVMDRTGTLMSEYLSDRKRAGSLAGSVLGGALTAHPAGPLIGSLIGFIIGKQTEHEDRALSTTNAAIDSFGRPQIVVPAGTQPAPLSFSAPASPPEPIRQAQPAELALTAPATMALAPALTQVPVTLPMAIPPPTQPSAATPQPPEPIPIAVPALPPRVANGQSQALEPAAQSPSLPAPILAPVQQPVQNFSASQVAIADLCRTGSAAPPDPRLRAACLYHQGVRPR